jgi:hypothetical protein
MTQPQPRQLGRFIGRDSNLVRPVHNYDTLRFFCDLLHVGGGETSENSNRPIITALNPLIFYFISCLIRFKQQMAQSYFPLSVPSL